MMVRNGLFNILFESISMAPFFFPLRPIYYIYAGI